MMKTPNSSSDGTAVDIILKELSTCFETTYAELLANLVRQPSFKQLRRLGEQQFFKATDSSHTLQENLRIKMQFTEMNLLAVSAVDMVDTVIAEKLRGNFLSKLKEEILEIILKLNVDQDSSGKKKSRRAQPMQTAENPKGKKTENMKIVPEKLSGVSRYTAENLNDISKQVIDTSAGNSASVSKSIEKLLSNVKEENIEETDNDDFELENLSFDSVSSVHTSDLSSFNDEISISSDEEIGEKRKKLSLKLLEEEIEQMKTKRKKVEKNEETQIERIKPKNFKSEVSTNDSSSIQQKSLPLRVRKPNSKYNTFGIISSLRRKSSEKIVQDEAIQKSETANSIPKRGRPRKSI